jgi:carbamoyltransferase
VTAVVHIDGTIRLQTVREGWNSVRYRWIQQFYELAGVPVILNASYNIMVKPMIHSLEDVLIQKYSEKDCNFIIHYKTRRYSYGNC